MNGDISVGYNPMMGEWIFKFDTEVPIQVVIFDKHATPESAQAAFNTIRKEAVEYANYVLSFHGYTTDIKWRNNE